MRNPASDRLKAALDLAGVSAFSLHKALRGQGVKGSSYTNIREVLEGLRAPATPLLQAAAPLLRVREEWLVLGTGAMTAPETEQFDGGGVVDVRAALEAEIPDLREADDYVVLALVAATNQWIPFYDSPDASLFVRLAGILWSVVCWPAQLLDDGTPGGAEQVQAWKAVNQRDGWVGYAVPMLFAIQLGTRESVMTNAEREGFEALRQAAFSPSPPAPAKRARGKAGKGKGKG